MDIWFVFLMEKGSCSRGLRSRVFGVERSSTLIARPQGSSRGAGELAGDFVEATYPLKVFAPDNFFAVTFGNQPCICFCKPSIRSEGLRLSKSLVLNKALRLSKDLRLRTALRHRVSGVGDVKTMVFCKPSSGN